MSGPTNDPMNHRDLTHTLNKRADDFARLGGHDLDLDQVVSRAGEIRRGRRMRATIAMAAVVVAVAAPVGVVTLQNRPAPGPVAPLTAGPTPTPGVVKLGDPVSLDDLESGDPTNRAYAAGGELHLGAQTLPVPGAGEIGAVARIDGGFLVGQYGDTGETARFIADDGSADNSWPMTEGSDFVVNDAGTVAAFLQADGQVVAIQDGGSRWFDVGTTLPASGGGYSIDAIRADSCTDRSESNVCTVWVTSQGARPQLWAVSQHHAPRAVLPGWLKLNDVTAADVPLFAGQISSSNEGSCSQVTEGDGDQAKPLWKTCDNSFDTFSPNGRYLLAGPAYRDGPGNGVVTVLDARTGASVTTVTATRDAVFSQYLWEDDTHLLAVVQDLSGNGREGLVRIGLDGSRELVAPIVDLGTGGNGYRLPRK